MKLLYFAWVRERIGLDEENVVLPSSVKTVSDLFIPLSGEIIEFNEALEDDPEKVNSDPYGDGWMVKIKISKPSEIDGLLSADAHKELIGA